MFFPSGNHTQSATVPSFLNNSSMDVGPSTMDTLVPVTPPSPTDGGNTSRVTRTTAPLPPGTTHTTRPLQDQVQGSTTATRTTPGAGSTLGTSSLASASTNSTATLSQQEHTMASLAGPGTSATAKNTPPTDSVTTSVSTPIPTKTTSPSSPLPSLRATSPDQTSPSTASPAARTVATSTTSTSTELLPGTKDAVPEVVEVPLTTHLVDTASLLAIVLFGLVFFLITVAVFAVQAYESYKMKDYTQVDYLINGMYNDSGV